MKKLCVIGSLNIDLTITIPRFHLPGESITGTDFQTFTGGKGGNQAVALGRLGADVKMVGMLGDDANGSQYIERLNRENINTACVGRSTDAPSGVALIEVDASSGDNRIAVAPGANMVLDRKYVDENLDFILSCDIYLMQLEIPVDTVNYLAEKLHAADKVVILDPAPAQPISDDLIRSVDFITPNETELAILTGREIETDGDTIAAARSLIARGAKAVIAKMGAAGAMYITEETAEKSPGFQVKALDTTAAGDSFNAGFAYGLAQGMAPIAALRLANAVAALSTTAMGAQSAMGTIDQVRALMDAQGSM